jgi:hypothetical protein
MIQGGDWDRSFPHGHGELLKLQRLRLLLAQLRDRADVTLGLVISGDRTTIIF